jgi:hypothetical protein
MGKCPQNMTQTVHPQTQEITSTGNTKKTTPRHIVTELLKINDMQKTLKIARRKKDTLYAKEKADLAEIITQKIIHRRESLSHRTELNDFKRAHNT